jgi:hypothetical protein
MPIRITRLCDREGRGSDGRKKRIETPAKTERLIALLLDLFSEEYDMARWTP